MGYLRPNRIVTTDEAIRDAVIAELRNWGSEIVTQSDAGTAANNIVHRIQHPLKTSEITGFLEDDDQFTIVTNSPDEPGGLDAEIHTDEGWKRFQRRIPGFPGGGVRRKQAE